MAKSEELAGALKKFDSNLNETKNASLEAIEKSKEAVAKAEKMAGEVSELQEKLLAREKTIEELVEGRASLLERLNALDEKLAAAPAQKAAPKKLYEVIFEDDNFKNYKENGFDGKMQGSIKFKAPKLNGRSRFDKGLVTSITAADGSNLLGDTEWDGLHMLPQRPVGLMSIMREIQTNRKRIEFIRQTGVFALLLHAQADALVGATSVTVETEYAHAVSKDVAVKFNATDSILVTAVDTETGVLTLASPLTVAISAGDEITQETFNFVGENLYKPPLTSEESREFCDMETVAAHKTISRQALEYGEDLDDYLETEMLFALMRSAERKLLHGDGGPGQITGFFKDADVLSYIASATATRYECVRRAINVANLNGYTQSTHVIINPNDFTEIEVSKDENENYIHSAIPLFDAGGNAFLWRLAVVETTQMSTGEFLVGDFDRGAVLYTNGDYQLRMADQHKDLFVKNQVVLLLERDMCLVIRHPQAFVKGAFSDSGFVTP